MTRVWPSNAVIDSSGNVLNTQAETRGIGRTNAKIERRAGFREAIEGVHDAWNCFDLLLDAQEQPVAAISGRAKNNLISTGLGVICKSPTTSPRMPGNSQ